MSRPSSRDAWTHEIHTDAHRDYSRTKVSLIDSAVGSFTGYVELTLDPIVVLAADAATRRLRRQLSMLARWEGGSSVWLDCRCWLLFAYHTFIPHPLSLPFVSNLQSLTPVRLFLPFLPSVARWNGYVP